MDVSSVIFVMSYKLSDACTEHHVALTFSHQDLNGNSPPLLTTFFLQGI